MQKKKIKQKSVRLVPHVYPTRYKLTLRPDMEAFTFEGKEVIDIVLDKETKEITLHSKDIKIETVQITGKTCYPGSQVLPVICANQIKYDEKAETATFIFKNTIPKGKAKLTIVFAGIISDGLRGLYKSKYVLDGKEKFIATTQFEATDARRAFPCFDEPAHKAVFDVELIIPNSHTAISNTLPTNVTEHSTGFKVVRFSPTPKMSTYLLAFITGEFEYIEGKTKDKVQVRVFTTHGKKNQAKFALDVAIRSLEFYNNYFGIAYPLPTLDLIALPDFESAAMENWGAVTFRETALLVDDEHTSFANKQWVAIVIAHELAHQWFGNLVTMHWWTDLWLNEGFASYMEYFCTDHMFPEWKVWDLYLSDRYSVALRLDALANSHPIEVHVHHPNEISEIFDAVSYAKGSAVIRMLAEYLGQDVFKKGLQHYMKLHSYKNTHTVDLWASFEKVSKKPVKKMMQNWTGKMGYPLLSLSKNKNVYKLSQERFFSSRVEAKKNKEKTLWQIPLDQKLYTKKETLLEEKIGKLNKGETTLTRVKYDELTLIKLKQEIVEGKMHVHDRLGIIRDLFALAEGGYINADVALDFSLSYKNEKEYIVWAELASGIDRIYHVMYSAEKENSKEKELYKKYALTFFSPLAEQMSFEKKKGEHNTHTFLRNLALAHAGLYGDKKIIKKAKEMFVNSKKKALPADIRSTIYGIVGRSGGVKEWKIFENIYLTSKLDEEKDRAGRALAQFSDKTLLARTLTFTMSKSVRMQDAPFILGTVWSNSRGRDLTWQFVKHNWVKLLKIYGEGGHFLSRLISPLGTHTSMKDAKDIEKFFKKNNAPGAARTIEQSLEKIYSNASWLASDKTKIKKWLEKNYK